MRKVILLIGLIVLSSIIAKSQTTVITDDSTYTPTSANAIFEVFSQNNDKGILIPRLTTAQRSAIATSGAVDQSLMVFDTDTKTFWYFDGTAWVEMATGGTVSDNQNIDSLTLNGLTLTTYIENGNSAFVDLTAVSDSAISYIINNSDTLFSNSAFTDSIVSIINNNIDTLFLNQTFIDSLASVIYNQGDTLLYNQTFISALQDSIDTDIDNAYLTGNTLNIDENGNTVSVDLTALVNDADSDPTNEIELPATAVNGQVLTWDGTDWIAQNPGSGADNWGTQVVISDGTLDGDGTSANPLTVNSTATDNQNIQGSSVSNDDLIIGIENGNSQTVDMSHFMDNTDNQALSISDHTIALTNGGSVTVPDNDTQDLSLSGNTLSLTDGGSVDLATITSTNSWNLLGNSGTTSSDFIGTTDDISLNFRIDNTKAGKISKDNTFFGYETGSIVTTGTYNSFFGYGAGKGITTGSFNTGLGYCAINRGSNSGAENIAVGKFSMFYAPSGDNNIAIGGSAYSLPSNTGTENIFIGHYTGRDQNTATSYSVGLGAYSNVDADYATAIGYKSYANQSNSLILGQTVNDGNPNSATANTNVGINSIIPDTYANLTLGNMDDTNEGGQISFAGAGSYTGWVTDLYQNNYRIFSQTSSTTTVQIFNNDGTGVSDLWVEGTGYATNWITTSDSRIKENQKDINYGLSTIMQITPKSYEKHYGTFSENGIEISKESVHSIGFIAQELYKVIPEAVHKPKDENKELWGVSYNKVVPVTVKAIQELKLESDKQQATISELKAQNELLKKQNSEIMERLKKLEEK